jgi:hypothetical protein
VGPSAGGYGGKAATFNLSPEKRTSLDFAIDHLAKEAKGRRKSFRCRQARRSAR